MKKIIAAAAAALIFAQTAYAAQFNDTMGHWAQREINILADKGIINGVADGRFEPEGEVTRAQYLKMVMEAVGIASTEYRPGQCLDADGGDWYAPYLQSALDKGLIPPGMVAGYKVNVRSEHDEEGNSVSSSVSYSGAFNGGIEITREEAAVLTMNLCQYTLNAATMSKLTFDTEELSFKDAEDIDSRAKRSVELAAANGIITGMDDGSFAPKSTATRAQAAVMINRLIDVIGG